MIEAFAAAGGALAAATGKLFWMAVAFCVLALCVHGWRGAVAAARRSASETRVNLVFYLTDAAQVVPLTAAAVAAAHAGLTSAGLALLAPTDWSALPGWAVLLAAVAASDFAGYWRHRLMHHAALWPAHAVHHSDREMTWLALARFHPVNRAVAAAVNVAVLAALGFPMWAVLLNALIRNWYGHFVHADLPWTYGRVWSRVFVSPVLHRWHHTRDEAQSGRNFSTVFALWDWMFGTWYCPGRHVGALGIEEPGFPESWAGQIAWPFRVWIRRWIAGPAIPARAGPD